MWICLHGYGQLAKYFIPKFEFLDPEIHFVIVPEGLNRFYFEGLSERPVATWMTREDRLDDIADFVLFLEELRRKIGWEQIPGVRVVAFGFSQGVTTLLRWMNDRTPKVDHLVLWAGGVPEDIRYDHRRSYYGAMDSHYFLGDKDPYIKPENLAQRRSLLETGNLHPQLHLYPGEHRVDETVLRTWVDTSLLA